MDYEKCKIKICKLSGYRLIDLRNNNKVTNDLYCIVEVPKNPGSEFAKNAETLGYRYDGLDNMETRIIELDLKTLFESAME